MKSLLRAIASPLLGEVEPYRVLRVDSPGPARGLQRPPQVSRVDADAIVADPIASIREQAWYCGSQSAAYAWTDGGQTAALCFYWWGERYRQRNFWPLAEGQAKLVQVITAPEHRGKGVARRLISASSAQMFDDGFERLYARVWHSNAPSLAAFDAAGWKKVAFVVRCSPPWRRSAIRLTLGQAPEGQDRPV